MYTAEANCEESVCELSDGSARQHSIMPSGRPTNTSEMYGTFPGRGGCSNREQKLLLNSRNNEHNIAAMDECGGENNGFINPTDPNEVFYKKSALGTEIYDEDQINLRGILRKNDNCQEIIGYHNSYVDEEDIILKKFQKNSQCTAIKDRIIMPIVAEFFSVLLYTFIYFHINDVLNERYLQALHKTILMSFLEAILMTAFLSAFQTVHMSPIISIAHLFSLNTSWFLCFMLVIIQLCATVVGALLHNFLSNTNQILRPALLENLNVEWRVSMIQLIVCQFIGSMLVVMSNLVITCKYGRGSIFVGRTIRGPLCFFTSIFLATFLSLLHSTVSWNPLQAFFLSALETIVHKNYDTWNNNYIFWAGPVMGTLMASFLYRVVFAPDDKRLNVCGCCFTSSATLSSLNRPSNCMTSTSHGNNGLRYPQHV
uniref:Aquaporin n=1 Tax=Rhabditophanes sp. KR3021 TaxID=114890 RepID=A0AC35TKR8_9BILA